MSGNDNITLMGFMGTGKSSTGRCLATALMRKFVDMDALIEQREGCPINRIFRERGEASFRELERGLVAELCARRGLVIAAGGGVALDQDNL
ncbi:MAG: shikimate kinase, partial [Kiritimatiellia bacterium]|nr:shikimate kinase [Lentisphaerota bacterium]